MAECFENLENKDIEKSLGKVVDKYVKQEGERKTRFFVENDLEKILLNSAQS